MKVIYIKRALSCALSSELRDWTSRLITLSLRLPGLPCGRGEVLDVINNTLSTAISLAQVAKENTQLPG